MSESTKGYARPEADFTNWRYRTRARAEVKFCDRLKAIYLEEIALSGKRALAALKAGVSSATVSSHMKDDPEFCAAFDAAYDEYREKRVKRLEREAMRGFEETIFSPTGERSTRRRYETQLRVMLLRAHDPERYREKSEVDITVRGGPMLVPAMLDAVEWEKQFRAEQEKMALPSGESDLSDGKNIMDAEFVESTPARFKK